MNNDNDSKTGVGGGSAGGNGESKANGAAESNGHTPDPYGIIGVGKRGWKFFATLAETGRLTNRVGLDQQAAALGDLEPITVGMIDILETFLVGLRLQRKDLLARKKSKTP